MWVNFSGDASRASTIVVRRRPTPRCATCGRAGLVREITGRRSSGHSRPSDRLCDAYGLMSA